MSVLDNWTKKFIVTGAQLSGLVQAGFNSTIGDNISDLADWKEATAFEYRNESDDGQKRVAMTEKEIADYLDKHTTMHRRCCNETAAGIFKSFGEKTK